MKTGNSSRCDWFTFRRALSRSVLVGNLSLGLCVHYFLCFILYTSLAKVRTPALVVGVHLTQLFILPLGLVNKCIPGETAEGNNVVTRMSHWLLPQQTQGAVLRIWAPTPRTTRKTYHWLLLLPNIVLLTYIILLVYILHTNLYQIINLYYIASLFYVLTQLMILTFHFV